MNSFLSAFTAASFLFMMNRFIHGLQVTLIMIIVTDFTSMIIKIWIYDPYQFLLVS